MRLLHIVHLLSIYKLLYSAWFLLKILYVIFYMTKFRVLLRKKPASRERSGLNEANY